MKKVRIHLGYAGFCLAKENEVIKGGRRRKIKFHALWGLIKHPEIGWILYDTGYTDRFYDATKNFPNRIYALVTEVKVVEEDHVRNKLQKFNIRPEDIKHVIITHFHADHVCGLKDFPNATFYASRKALRHALAIPRPIAFSKGILKKLLPADLADRTVFIEDQGAVKQDAIFGSVHDLFGDDSILIYDLPGHAAGQIGVRLETKRKGYFLISDACWLKRAYEENILPNQIVRVFIHSWTDMKETLAKVHRFHKEYPEVVIVPTHCNKSTDPLVSDAIGLDRL